jgi:hypothetical protein
MQAFPSAFFVQPSLTTVLQLARDTPVSLQKRYPLDGDL